MFWISDRSLYKIFLAIKQRHKKYWTVGISRHEWDRFWLSEMKLRIFIEKLRKDWKLQDYKIGKERVKCMKKSFTCNVYKLSREFIEFLEKVREYVQKEKKYIEYTPDDVIAYVSSFAKRAYNQWKFCIDWIYYIVADRGKWRWKIYDTANNKIVSLVTIKNIK